MGLIAQLRQRRTVQILIGYIAAGWILLQAANQLVERGILPDVAYHITLVWYLGLIPAVAVVGWYHGEKGRQRVHALEVAVVVGLLAPLVLVTGAMVKGHRSDPFADADVLDLRRVAVLYFDDVTPDSSARHLADAFTESLISELAAVRGLDVVSRNGVAPFRGTTARRDSVARVLDAGTLVHGTVDLRGGRVRIGLRLFDGASGVEADRVSFDLPESEVLDARDEVAERAAALLRQAVGQAVSVRRMPPGATDNVAWSLYHRAERARKDAEAALQRGAVAAADSAFDAADAMLEQARAREPQWSDPAVLRALIAQRRAQLAGIAGDRPRALRFVEHGLAQAESVLARRPDHAHALYARGRARYINVFLIPDRSLQEGLFHAAKADLERAVRLDPTLAPAHAMLSHMSGADLTAAVLHAHRALEEDAYLEEADAVYWRLVNGHYSLGHFGQSWRWCEEAQRRRPHHFRFALCELLLMTTPVLEPDPDRAGALLGRVDSLVPGFDAEWEGLRARLVYGGVLARAGKADSARVVWAAARSRVDPRTDPDLELTLIEAHMRTLAGDFDEAIALLHGYRARFPTQDFEHHWRWRELRQHPRYVELTN